MKALKLSLVATMVAFAMVSAVNADGFKSKPKLIKVTNISLEQAKKNPGMVNAIYTQLRLGDLVNTVGKIYVGDIKYHGQVYRIKACYGEWLYFFRHIVNPPMHFKEGMKIIE